MDSKITFTCAPNQRPRTTPQLIHRATAEQMFSAIFGGRHTITQVLDEVCPQGASFAGEVKTFPEKSVSFEGHLINADGIPQHNLNFVLIKSSGQLYGERMAATAEGKDSVNTRSVLNGFKRIAKKLGLTEIIMRPGLTDGGWIWALQGVVPVDKSEAENLRDTILINRLHKHKDHIIETVGEVRYREIVKLISNLGEGDNLKKIAKLHDVKVEGEDGRKEHLGRAFLRGTSWLGRYAVAPEVTSVVALQDHTPSPVRKQGFSLKQCLSRLVPSA